MDLGESNLARLFICHFDEQGVCLLLVGAFYLGEVLEQGDGLVPFPHPYQGAYLEPIEFVGFHPHLLRNKILMLYTFQINF